MSFLNMDKFPNENIVENRNIPSLETLVGWLTSGELTFPPAKLRLRDEASSNALGHTDNNYDRIIDVNWDTKSTSYVFEYKQSNSPRVQNHTIALARHHASNLGLSPLIILPYLNDEALHNLDQQNVSGIDLCGNGLLNAPDFRLWRSGHPNRYRDTRPIRNPFGGDSGIFARCFLLHDHYNSLVSLLQDARWRTFRYYLENEALGLTQGTASKVVQALVDELIVGRDGIQLTLQDPRRLMALLRKGQQESTSASVIGSTPFGAAEVWDALSQDRYRAFRAVTTGISSAARYGVLSGADRLSLYVTDLNAVTAILKIRPGKAFANIELRENAKNAVYFDARQEGNILWASPIQTWLELTRGGPREQEAAEALGISLAKNLGANLL